MGRLIGFGLVAAGLGAAAYVLPVGDLLGYRPTDTRATVAAATPTISTQVDSPTGTGVRMAPTSAPSAQALLTASAPTPEPAVKPVMPRGPDFSAQNSPLTKTAAGGTPVPSAAASQEPKAARLAPIAPPTVRPAEAPRAQYVRSDGDGRTRLARDIQSELKRVGCFDGEATGEWTQTSQRAMQVFIDRVNARLPVNEPDYILLTLLQGQQTRVCGANCPSGQSLTGEGRCVPSAVLAQSQKRPVQPVARPTAPAVAPQQQAAAPVAVPAFPRAANETSPTAAPAPAVSSAPPVMAPVVATPVAPLPGRMAVGGPVAPQPVLAVPTPVPALRTGTAPPVAVLPRVASLQPGAQPSPAAPPAGQDPAAAAIPPVAPGAAPVAAAAPKAAQRPGVQARRASPPRGVAAGYPPPRVQPPPRQAWARSFFRQNDIFGR